jgi:pseudouridine-5'-phosphate glycosidase
MKNHINIKPEIKQAILEKKAVIALESTIISHGMPYPQNVETARKTEEIIRQNNAIPATIGIINGQIIVGLNDDELEIMGKSSHAIKVSRRDIPVVISRKLHGATTVASTMIFAEAAGIKVFVTGGIGGVHRGATVSFDISADLIELSNTNVAVVCAGAKSILDLGLTLEYLETLGVPVIGYKTDEFPAFYTRKSGHKLVHFSENITEIANMLHIKWLLNLKGGAVIANPIPEKFEPEFGFIDSAIEIALQKSINEGITGKNVTPFLLNEIKNETKGKSLEANIELVFNNAKVGAELSKAMSEIK